ncbi:MAG: hypothetical protein ACTSRH_09605 [Promethearchaeota archaeon]
MEIAIYIERVRAHFKEDFLKFSKFLLDDELGAVINCKDDSMRQLEIEKYIDRINARIRADFRRTYKYLSAKPDEDVEDLFKYSHEFDRILEIARDIDKVEACLGLDPLKLGKSLSGEEREAMLASVKERIDFLDRIQIIAPLWCSSCGFSCYNLVHDPFLYGWNCWYCREAKYKLEEFRPDEYTHERLLSFLKDIEEEKARYRNAHKLPEELLVGKKYVRLKDPRLRKVRLEFRKLLSIMHKIRLSELYMKVSDCFKKPYTGEFNLLFDHASWRDPEALKRVKVLHSEIVSLDDAYFRSTCACRICRDMDADLLYNPVTDAWYCEACYAVRRERFPDRYP